MKIKKLDKRAILPRYAHDGDACFDLFAIEDVSWEYSNGVQTATVRTGWAMEVPEGYAMKVYSRSGHGFNYGITLANSTGIIDSCYRGEVIVKLSTMSRTFQVEYGTKIAQACLVEVPKVFFDVVDELSITERNESGFGSSGL